MKTHDILFLESASPPSYESRMRDIEAQRKSQEYADHVAEVYEDLVTEKGGLYPRSELLDELFDEAVDIVDRRIAEAEDDLAEGRRESGQ